MARYGGEEFACILPETGFDHAMAIATDMEQKVRAQEIAHALSDVAGVVTTSVGLAVREADSPGDAQSLVGLADAQLYHAKQMGRGRVCGTTLSSCTPK